MLGWTVTKISLESRVRGLVPYHKCSYCKHDTTQKNWEYGCGRDHLNCCQTCMDEFINTNTTIPVPPPQQQDKD